MDSYTNYNPNTKTIKSLVQRWNNTALFCLVMLNLLYACSYQDQDKNTANHIETAKTATFVAYQKTLPPPLPPQRTTPTTTPIPTETKKPTLTPTNTATYTPTVTPTRTPIVPKARPEQLPLPRQDFANETHLFYGRPMLEGNNYPVSHYRYGMTWDGLLAPHLGVDLANDKGSMVVAIGNGTVIYSGNDDTELFGFRNEFYGNLIVLSLDQKWNDRQIYALYAHLSETNVEIGQKVTQGDIVGKVGESGAALAPHLHLEIRIDDPRNYMSTRNPELWYLPLPGTGVVAGRILDKNGLFIPGHMVKITCADQGVRWVQTYWNQWTPPDDNFSENFVFSDIPEMQCTVQSEYSGEIISQSIDIQPQDVVFVVLRHSS
ncbi:MAG: hypothetical protein CL606_06540 [Anaerolineaceae bacterium]|nr:hypothetical protein [Anaerolineaceae bacterium]